MTPDDLADKLRRLPPRPICEHGSIKSKCTECELIDAESEIARLRTALAASEVKLAKAREALATAYAWCQFWAVHVERCKGGDQCECGLTRARYETATTLKEIT